MALIRIYFLLFLLGLSYVWLSINSCPLFYLQFSLYEFAFNDDKRAITGDTIYRNPAQAKTHDFESLSGPIEPNYTTRAHCQLGLLQVSWT